MIKAKLVSASGKTVVILGLSRSNIDRLMTNQPIYIAKVELGVEHDIIIMGNETNDDLQEDLRLLGVVQ